MRFNVKLDAANLCILLVTLMSAARGPVVYRLGKILLEELTERFENGDPTFSPLEYELDVKDVLPDDLPYAVVALEEISEHAGSLDLQEFLEMIVSELRAEQLRRKE